MAVDYFLKIDGIDRREHGGRQAQGRDRGPVLVLGGVRPRSGTGPAAGEAQARCRCRTSTSTPGLSKASPHLLLACASGKHLKSAVLTARKAGKGQEESLTFSLSDLLVSSYQTGGTEGLEGVQMDLVLLNFAKIQVEYKELKADGTLGSFGQSRLGREAEQGVLIPSTHDRPHRGGPQRPNSRATTGCRIRACVLRRPTPAGWPPGEDVRARACRGRDAAGCSSSVAATAATSCRWRSRCRARAFVGIDLDGERSPAGAGCVAASASTNVEIRAVAIEELDATPRAPSTTWSRTASTRGWGRPVRDRLLGDLPAHCSERRRRVRQLQRATPADTCAQAPREMLLFHVRGDRGPGRAGRTGARAAAVLLDGGRRSTSSARPAPAGRAAARRAATWRCSTTSWPR